MNANRVYYIRIRGRVIGPKELPDMQRLAQRAQLNSRTPVSEDGLSWLTAGDFPEIFTKTTATAPPAQQQPADEATAVAAVAEEWHFAVNGQQHPNPVSLATLQSYVQAGTLGRGDLVFRTGWDNWQPVSSVPELSFSPAPAAVQPQYSTGAAVQPNGQSQSASSGFGVASLICGILGLIFFGCVFGPIAIVLGIIGASKNGTDTGMAWTGLILGIIDFIGWLILLAVLNANRF